MFSVLGLRYGRPHASHSCRKSLLQVLLEAALHPKPKHCPLPCSSYKAPPARKLPQCRGHAQLQGSMAPRLPQEASWPGILAVLSVLLSSDECWCTLPQFAARCLPHDAAGDWAEAPTTSSRHALRRASPKELKVDTGAAQAVRELKAEHRMRGVSTEDKHPGPDKVHMTQASYCESHVECNMSPYQKSLPYLICCPECSPAVQRRHWPLAVNR